jgi:undecaprenyl-diphosphatase
MAIPGWNHVIRHFRPRIDPDARYGLRLTLLAIAFTLIALPFAFLTIQVTTDGFLTEIDQELSHDLVEISRSNPTTKDVLDVVSFVGKPIFLVLIVGIPAIWLFRRGERRLVVYLVATAVTGGIVDTIIKETVDRPRPVFDFEVGSAYGTSFPSGHALASTVCYGVMLLVALPYIARRWRPLAIVSVVSIVLLIGFSRLALGLHFVSDVVAGYLFGVAWLMAATAVFSAWRVERHEPAVHIDTEGIEPTHDAEEDGDAPGSTRVAASASR